MDLPFHDVSDRILETFKSGISRLSKRARKSRLPRGVWIFPLALTLGVWANRNSRDEGRMEWLQANPPALETWRAVLLRRGFGPIDDPAWREKAFAEMPDIGRNRDSALISEDHTTFALRTEGDWVYFGLARNGGGGQTVKRELWERLGVGWEAVAHLDALTLPDFKMASDKPRISKEWRDSRSLDY